MPLNPNTDRPTATELDQFLAGLVADAAHELADENLTEFDRFLAGIVADAARDLAVEDEIAAADAARAVAPIHHVNRAVHGPVDSVFAQSLARILADLETVETPIERATRTGRIGGDATPQIEPESKSGGYVVTHGVPVNGNNVTARFLPMPNRAVEYPCPKPRWVTGLDYTGLFYVIAKPCEGDCIACSAYALQCKIVRWENGSGLLQTVINVTGAANADEARKWTGALSKAIGKLPDRATLVTEYGEILIVFADALEVGTDLITRIWKFANAEHGNAKRPSKTWPHGRPAMQCLFGQNAVVTGVDLAAFIGGNRTAQGERRHVSWRLHGDAFATPPREDDFAFGPGRPLPDNESPPAQPEVSDAVVKSRTKWRKVIAPRLRQTMREGERAEQAMTWCAGKTLITHTGPPKLLKQYAAFKAGKRDYEPAWDYVAAMVGDDPPTPWRQPRDCKGCGFPYYPTPGRRQCANCEGE